jgi:tRNA/tmRNA/rRNA uracil-C5-methylase (TrmA/RlmC/RlmD family)/predicted kinase
MKGHHVTKMATTKQPKKKKQKPPSPSLTGRLFETLLACQVLHIPSTLTQKYRNKITYGIPLPSPLSILAQDTINKVCEIVAAFEHSNIVFREVMVKKTRSGSLLVRITVQKTDEVEWKEPFVAYMCHHCPKLECLCYNETETTARPTKEDPLHPLFGKKHVLETTPPPNPRTYQLSPDTFCEINHEVERLQYDMAKEWLLKYCSPTTTTSTTANTQTLLVSGRDISSFGLGFGSLHNNNHEKLFNDVLAVQHCPLVHADAVANFERHKETVEAAVHHKSKQEMVEAIQAHFKGGDDHSSSDDHYEHVSVGVMTGGRKGLDPSYLDYLVGAQHLQVIIYNSCSTKSLVRDMEGFLKAFTVEDFRSYNFFPGTSYTASLTLLIRRPKKTLILPVGPAGVGKTSLAKSLVEEGSMSMSCWQRDVVFSHLREQGMGLNKAKHQVHQDLLSFLSSRTGILYVDSTNGNAEARHLYVKEAKADRVVYVEFKLGGTEEAVLEFLMNQTRNRLGDNTDNHPGFPDTIEEQRKKHINILKGITYPTLEETTKTVTQDVYVLSCDPIEDLGRRSFRLFVAISCSEAINQTIS